MREFTLVCRVEGAMLAAAVSDHEEKEGGYAVPRQRSSARWIVGIVMAGLLGWTGSALYDRFSKGQEPPQEEAVDQRLERFLKEGQAQLAAGDFEGASEQLTKASGISDKDPRVIEGVAHIAMLRAEMAFWRYASAADKGKLLDGLKNVIAKARTKSQRGRGALDDHAPAIARLKLAEQRLDAMLVYALQLAGKSDEAKAVKSSHPEAESLAGMSAQPASTAEPSASAAPTASASASASPTASASSAPASKPTSNTGQKQREDYEFSEEPETHEGPKTKGELEIPQ